MKVVVIGSGTMGCGIAQTAIASGHETMIVAHSEKSMRNASDAVASGLDKAIKAGRLTAEGKVACLKLLSVSFKAQDVDDADLVIEAVPEDLKLKREVLLSVETCVSQHSVIATNTSSIRIDTMATALKDSTRFLGLHFFNPVPVMKLVELVKGGNTSDWAVDVAKDFAQSLGKTVVPVKDSPGFVSNRILMAYINEAMHTLEDGVATKESIDTVARMGFNHPMGPIELADFIGLDVCMDIMERIYEQKNDEKFKPAPILVRMVKEGRLGRKTKKGFYEY
jgi:3-hydroxybutyryl-CoA dehydrogenase